MKKIIIIGIVLVGICGVSFAQGQLIDKLFEVTGIAPPTLVVSPQLLQPLTNMQAIQKKIEASKEVATMITSLRSLHKFASIVEETRCATEDLRYAISQLEFTRSAYIQRCDFEVRFNVAVYQLSSIPDLINTILRSTNMEGSDRLKIMSDTMDKFEKTNKDVVSLTKDLTDQIVLEEVEDKYRIDREWSLRNVF